MSVRVHGEGDRSVTVLDATATSAGGDGGGGFSITAAAYEELMAATEKYIALLGATSQGFLGRDDVMQMDAVTFRQGLSADGRPAVLTVDGGRLVVDTPEASDSLPLADVVSAEPDTAGPATLRVRAHPAREIVVQCRSAAQCAAVAGLLRLRADCPDEDGGDAGVAAAAAAAAAAPAPALAPPQPPSPRWPPSDAASSRLSPSLPACRDEQPRPHPRQLPEAHHPAEPTAHQPQLPTPQQLHQQQQQQQPPAHWSGSTPSVAPPQLSRIGSDAGGQRTRSDTAPRPPPSFLPESPSPSTQWHSQPQSQSQPHSHAQSQPQSHSQSQPQSQSPAVSAQHQAQPAEPPVPLTRNVADVADLEGLAVVVSNLSPHGHPLQIELAAACGEATVVPIGRARAAVSAAGDRVALSCSIPPGEALAVAGFDPRPNHARGQTLDFAWGDDTARAAVSFYNAAPRRVRVAGTVCGADTVAALPSSQATRHSAAEFSVSLLPGETRSLLQLTSTGRSTGASLCTLRAAFDPLTPQQQAAYLLPLAEADAEPPSFSLFKLVSDYGFAPEAADAYMRRRLQHELQRAQTLPAMDPSARLAWATEQEGRSFLDPEFLQVMEGELPPGATLRRPQHFLPVHREAAVMVGDPAPGRRIGCGRLGHKWWVGGVRAVSEHPDLVRACFSEYDLPAGYFTARVCTSGWWMDIVCDTWVPCDAEGPCFARGESRELWVPLLEKASAWLAGGYSNLAHGTVGRALALFTGAPYHRVRLGGDSVVDAAALWDELCGWLEQACIVCVSADGVEPVPGAPQPDAPHPSAATLPVATVLDAVAHEGRQLLRLRGDPLPAELPWSWGDGVWRRGDGRGSRVSAAVAVYARLPKQASAEEDARDGVFWVELGDAVAAYASLTVCHLRRGWGDVRVHGEVVGRHCDFVVEVQPEKTTRAVVQLQPASPGAAPTLCLTVLKRHADPMVGYEPVALLPAPNTPPAGPDDPPVAVEMTLQEGAEYVVIPGRVDGGGGGAQFVLSIHTEVAECGWAYLKKASPHELGEVYYAAVCRQGKGQDAKPLPNGRQGETAVWWREDTGAGCGMVLENTSSAWEWQCEVDTEAGPARVSLPPNSKAHVFPDLTKDRRLHYDHFVSIYHTSTYREAQQQQQTQRPPFTYASGVVLPTIERPVQKGVDASIHSWHTIRL